MYARFPVKYVGLRRISGRKRDWTCLTYWLINSLKRLQIVDFWKLMEGQECAYGLYVPKFYISFGFEGSRRGYWWIIVYIYGYGHLKITKLFSQVQCSSNLCGEKGWRGMEDWKSWKWGAKFWRAGVSSYTLVVLSILEKSWKLILANLVFSIPCLGWLEFELA